MFNADSLSSMITEKLADFIIQTEYDKIPKNAVEKAKLCFLDFLGVALRGSQSKSGVIVTNILEDGLKDADESTVLGHQKASPLDASLANGIFAHSLDLDDGHRLAQLHPGCCVIPAALSLCESRNKSGKDFISSVVVGYETAIALGMLVNPNHRTLGFHSTGTCGAFGAAAAACKSMNLKYNEILNTLGLAGTQAAGLLESDHAGSMGKHLHAGKAAQSGVLSALLARNGFTGAKSIIDGKEGFLNAMVYPNIEMDDNKTDNIKIDDGTDAVKTDDKSNDTNNGKNKNGSRQIDLDKYHISDVYFKKYPVCRHLHSTIDATLDILNQVNLDNSDGLRDVNGITSEQIHKITVKTYKITAGHDNYHPETIEALRQSLPVSLAIAISKGNLNLNNLEITEDIKKISNKIVIEHDANFDELYPLMRPSEVRVTITNKTNGDYSKTYNKHVDLPQGEPENPFKKDVIIEKFHDLNPEVDLDVLKVIDDIELYRMGDLMDILNEEFKLINTSKNLNKPEIKSI
ncbi:MmgE/PrpD family protein [Methanobacterium paludis]|uniref:MmgE/PrpD family protein n=2 Tax=Methanobacterium paludis (strain DSM 25820 / JCM 18151 / SWAN1) TaxID=868131 RepID=F6D6T3_METPW|nr:MmgE/PrpD family protein [Methanobacterium paludis]